MNKDNLHTVKLKIFNILENIFLFLIINYFLLKL